MSSLFEEIGKNHTWITRAIGQKSMIRMKECVVLAAAI
jgi:hypothetical protein